MSISSSSHPFDSLTPDFILDAVEDAGYQADGRVTALNSYENRVYQVGVEDQTPVIAKFYRPGRWSDRQIQEEHDFTYELVDAEIPVVTAFKKNDECLFYFKDFRFSLYPRVGGRAPELDNLDNLYILGRFLGRIHGVGACKCYSSRPSINSQAYGHESVQLISADFIPSDLKLAYDSLSMDILALIDQILGDYGSLNSIRVHGDCHIGNILWRDDNPYFIDFDDSRMAPAVQDIWMLLSGDRNEQRTQLREIIEGYNEFAEFDVRELGLIEVLRTLRMFYFSAWLARRWDDPAFPLGFPWFNTQRYWEEHILNLREQFSSLNEDPISLEGII